MASAADVSRPSSPSVAGDDPLARVARLDGVTQAVADARASVDKVLAHRVLRRGSAAVTTESTLRSARATAALEGFDVPLEALRAHLVDGAGAVDPAMAVVDGAVRLHAGLGTLRMAWERAPRQALARIHVLAARGLARDDTLGRPRAWSAEAGPPGGEDPLGLDPLHLGPPPSPTEVSARLGGLADLLVAPTSAPAIVVAAVAHGELLALRPFGLADGLVARAAGRLVLIGRGLDPKAVTAVEVGHVEDGGYAEAARAYVAGDPAGVAAWVIHCARAVELGARESLAICEAILRAE